VVEELPEIAASSKVRGKNPALTPPYQVWYTPAMAASKKRIPKNLKQLEEEALAERPKRKKKTRATRNPQKDGAVKKLGHTRAGNDVRKGKRKPPPVPDASFEQIKAMDPDDPAFKHPQGGPRKTENTKDLPWKEAAKRDKQRRSNARRAKIRKHEALVVKAVQERGIVRGSVDNPTDNALVADHILDLDDWDREELIRGYRRNRNGKFGQPPKYIPREVQQECWKRLVKIGEKELKGAYLDVVKNLINLAKGTDDDGDPLEIPAKVQLEASKEVMERLVGKIPEHLRVSPDAPWQDYLADSLEPVSLVERTTTEIEGHRFTEELGDGDDEALDAAPDALPSPSPDIEVPVTRTRRKKGA
jgi:hypothetical protein